MKLSPEEREERRASFRRMTAAQRAEYVFSYYRLPIVLALLALVVLGDVTYRHFTRKEALLYTAYINVSVGESLDEALGPGFVAAQGAEPKKSEVAVSRNLFLSRDPSGEDHQYAYASRLKLMASVESKKMDLVLMNQEAYDILSQDGYLYDIPSILGQDPDLARLLEPLLTENTVILQDNSIEYDLNEAAVYESVTEEHVNGIEVTSLPLFQGAGFSGPVYLGVIANSPRLPAVFGYIRYLLSAAAL